MNKLVTHAGQWLAPLTGAALTSSWQGGEAFSLQGTDQVDAELLATFDAATGLTSIDYRLEVSDDGTNWEPIPSIQASTTQPGVAFSLAAAAGTTVRDRLLTENHRNAKFCRVATKCTGAGAGSGTDSSTSNLNFSE